MADYVYDELPLYRVPGEQISTVSVYIDAGGTVSTAIDMDIGRVIGVIIPAAFTPADLTFLVSADGDNYYPLYDYDVERSIVYVATGVERYVTTLFIDWMAVRALKIRSGLSSAPVIQDLARELKLVLAYPTPAFVPDDQESTNTLSTVAQYIDAARVLLQDRVVEYRYSDIDLMSNLNIALTEVRRLRPDLFLDTNFGVIPSFYDPEQVVEFEPQFRMALVYYICGQAQLSDQEDTQDARATIFLNKFVAQLTTIPS